MSQIMSAVVGVLNESVMESLKGFYKLRKAYVTLDAIATSERQYLERKGIVRSTKPSSGMYGNTTGNSSTASFGRSSLSARNSRSHLSKQAVPGAFGQDSDDEDEFFDATESSNAAATLKEPASYNNIAENTSRLSLEPNQAASPVADTEGPDPAFFANPIDAFIHSGTALNYGLLLTLLSVIPPTFSKLLSIIGFRGDRERGLKLLWQATRFDNINGAIAGLALLGYYTNVVTFGDILPSDAYPKARCKALLDTMRQRFPQSRMWLLEEARMLASERRLEDAVAKVAGVARSNLRQVEALQYFETSLNHMYLHDYAACAASFLACVDLNSWSHALYYYAAAAAHVELYRLLHAHGDRTLASAHADKAEALLRKVPEAAGKKRFMARQMPFDAFVGRKVAKWQAREKELGVRLADAAGVSPVEEVIYFWGGHKRMRAEQLETSLARLAWSDGGANPRWDGEAADERAILVVLRAAVLRNLGRRDEAMRLLKGGIIERQQGGDEVKGGFKDNWPAPVARYEMAVNLWQQDQANATASNPVLLAECSDWLEKVAAWESFDLDARIGMKVTTARGTLKKMGYGST